MSFTANDAWSAMVYGETHPSDVAFMQNRIVDMANYVSEAGREYYNKTLQLFDHYNGSAALQFARRVVNSFQSKKELPYIVAYNKLDEFQQATTVMQRWIMANPHVRQKYIKQRCDGYCDTYVDLEPGKIGKDHYDYRMATSGLVEFDEEGSWKASIYFDDLREGDRPLIFEEKLAIRDSWRELEYYMALAKDDPTSASGGKL